MGDAYPGRAEARDLVGVRSDNMGAPRTIGQPADVFVQLDGTHTECRDRVLVVLGVLRKMGMESNVEALGKLGSATHQVGGDAKWAARGQGDLDHRTVVRVVPAVDMHFRVCQDLILGEYGIVGR